jgi:hypothetical protein
MPALTITVDNEFIDMLAEAIARRSLGEMAAPGPYSEPPPPAPSDPWDSSPPPPPAAQPPAPAPQPAPPAQSGTFAVSTPKGPQQWSLGRTDAPPCECGTAAAYVQGSTNGKTWRHWRCAKGISQDTWRSKCNFSQWA